MNGVRNQVTRKRQHDTTFTNRVAEVQAVRLNSLAVAADMTSGETSGEVVAEAAAAGDEENWTRRIP